MGRCGSRGGPLLSGAGIRKRPLRSDGRQVRRHASIIGFIRDWNVWIVLTRESILRAASVVVLLTLGQFNRSEPFVSQQRDKVFIIKVGFETMKENQVGPRGRDGRGTGVNGLEEIVVNNVKLGADVIRSKVTNESNSTSMKRAGAHVLSLARPRLPLGHFPSILEPRLKHINGTTPRMSVDQRTKGGLGAGPELMGREARGLCGILIVEVDDMANSKGPEVPMTVFGPSKGSKDHDGATCPNGVLDGIFSNPIMMVPPDPTMLGSLPL